MGSTRVERSGAPFVRGLDAGVLRRADRLRRRRAGNASSHGLISESDAEASDGLSSRDAFRRLEHAGCISSLTTRDAELASRSEKALTGSDANANLTLDGRLVTRQGYSVALGLGHAWSDTLASNLALAWTDLENIGEREPDAIQSGGVSHINLIWTPREKLSTGIELMWGTRENADGDDGSATRVQTMVKYFF